MKIAVLNINGVQSELQGKKQHYFVVTDDYNFSGNSATDVTSIDTVDLFYTLLRIDYVTYREHLMEFANDNTFGSLSVSEKKILAKNFVINKVDRDTVYTDDEQNELALDFQEKLTKAEIKLDFNNNIDDIINKEPNEISVVGELPNYKELDITIQPSFVGTWHEVTLPSGITTNSIVMVSCSSEKDNKIGGVREVGSSIDRRKVINKNGSLSLLVKVNNNRKVEFYAQTNHISFYINAQIS